MQSSRVKTIVAGGRNYVNCNKLVNLSVSLLTSFRADTVPTAYQQRKADFPNIVTEQSSVLYLDSHLKGWKQRRRKARCIGQSLEQNQTAIVLQVLLLSRSQQLVYEFVVVWVVKFGFNWLTHFRFTAGCKSCFVCILMEAVWHMQWWLHSCAAL